MLETGVRNEENCDAINFGCSDTAWFSPHSRGAAAEESLANRAPIRVRPATDSWAEAIRLALRELGYIEGENIAIEYRYAEGKPDRAHELATELVRFKVDIIVVAGGDTLVRPVMNGTKTIHIVMMGGGVILSGRAWLKALPVLVATSRVLRFSPEN